MNYLSFDVGTTACKCQLFSEDGNILEYLSKEYGFCCESGETYVDISAIKENVFSMIKAVSSKHRVESICFSTFGEAFVLLDKEDNVLFRPMLYTDRRGEDQAEEMRTKFGNEKLYKITGTLPHHMYSVSKLLYVKQNYPDVYAKVDKVLLICDYLGYILTGKRMIDYSLAARTGIFDIEHLCFSEELCKGLEIDKNLFSKPDRTGYIVGEINNIELGLKDCKLVLGSHDQICTALGAGVISDGQAVDGMGTVECITAVFKDRCSDINAGVQGYPVVPFAVEGLYCTYICNYASGSIVNWYKNEMIHGYKGDKANVFDYLESGFSENPSGLYILPYFAGAAIPYQDTNAKGAIVGLTTSTTASRIYQALMEGTSMEMKFEVATAKKYGIKVKSAVATGGGANSDKWVQIKADIQGIPYKTLRSSEGGLCGCAVLQSVAVGGNTLEQAVKIFVKKKKAFKPDKGKAKVYEPYYKKYKKLYKSLKEFF